MAAEKRSASNVFESQQLVVKRQKSDADLQPGNALTTSRGGSGLAQVSIPLSHHTQAYTELLNKGGILMLWL